MSGIEVAIGAVVASSLAATAGTVMSAREQSRASSFQQQQYDQQAQATHTASLQSEARRREELLSNLETINAIRAGRGVGDSPTGAAISGKVISDAERNISTERLNFLQQGDNARMAGIVAGQQAQSSMIAGGLSALSTLGEGVYKGYLIKKGT